MNLKMRNVNEKKERKAQMLAESGLYGALWRRRSPGNNDNEHFQETFPHTHPHPLFDQEHHHLNITG